MTTGPIRWRCRICRRQLRGRQEQYCSPVCRTRAWRLQKAERDLERYWRAEQPADKPLAVNSWWYV